MAPFFVILGLMCMDIPVTFEKDAKFIALLSDDVEYTRYLTAVIEGETISGPNDETELPNFLPEEGELPDTNFSE